MPVISPGIRGQTHLDDLLDFSGAVASGGTPQILCPQQPRRLSIFIGNLAASNTITIGIGPPKCTATLTGNTVTSIAASNAGLGYSIRPNVRILGGLIDGDYQLGPARSAVAHAVMTGSAPNQTISSIVIDDPGSGYLVAPLIYLENPLPTLGGGATIPSATAGIPLLSGQSLTFSGSILVPTSAIAIFSAGTDAFVCKIGGLV